MQQDGEPWPQAVPPAGGEPLKVKAWVGLSWVGWGVCWQGPARSPPKAESAARQLLEAGLFTLNCAWWPSNIPTRYNPTRCHWCCPQPATAAARQAARQVGDAVQHRVLAGRNQDAACGRACQGAVQGRGAWLVAERCPCGGAAAPARCVGDVAARCALAACSCYKSRRAPATLPFTRTLAHTRARARTSRTHTSAGDRTEPRAQLCVGAADVAQASAAGRAPRLLYNAGNNGQGFCRPIRRR